MTQERGQSKALSVWFLVCSSRQWRLQNTRVALQTRSWLVLKAFQIWPQNKLNQCKKVDPEGSRGHRREGTGLEAPLPSLWLLNINMKPVSLLCYIPRREQPAAGQCQAITPQSLHASTALGHVKPGAGGGYRGFNIELSLHAEASNN